ncbi:MAG TPA: PD-(D/E)XK nuclease family protein [Candidatus Ratteibacteria bacterium]|nr:PD-(D/E)XK nuclease family protein [Candidatus Ratteibacteria bacterium]
MNEKNNRYLLVFPFSFDNRTGYIVEKFFKDKIDFSNVIHLTSRQARIADFRTRLALSIKKPIIPPASFPIKAFAAKVVNEKTKYRLISPIEQILILFNLSRTISGNMNVNPVTFSILLRLFIKDFKVSHEEFDFDLWIDKVDKYPWKYEDNKSIVKEALKIMEKYQEILERDNLIDEDDLYRISEEHLGDLHFDTVLLDGILEFIPSQRSFIKKICERSKQFISTYQFDDNVYYDARTLILEENFNFLKSLSQNIEYAKSSQYECKESLYSFPSPDEEVKSIGNMIINAISQNNILNWEDFLVVFPDMLYYRPLVQRIFNRLEIPFCMTPGYVLSQDPSIISIVSFMEWVNYPSWEKLMSLFTSPFFSFDKKEAEKFSLASRKTFGGIGFFPSNGWLNNWENWRKIEKAKNLMTGNIKSITQWCDCLKESMKELGWKMFDYEGNIALMEIFDELKDDTSLDLTMFRNIFNATLDITEVEKSRGKGVRVMGVLDSMGVESSAVFFGGVDDDNLPMSAKKDEFFLPDPLKKDLQLTTYELKIARERLDLYRLKKSGKKIIFTYPARVGGRQKNKSIMLHNLLEESIPVENFVYNGKNIFSVSPDYEKFLSKFFKDDIFNFTVSQIDDLSRCPYMFYLKYVEKIEPYKEPIIEEIPELWGRILHTAAEKAAQDFVGRIQDTLVIEAQYEKFCSLVNKFLENPGIILSHYDYKLPAVIRTFLEKRKQHIFNAFLNIMKKHQGHKILEIEKKQTVTIGNVNIIGKIDRIEKRENDIFEIIDYKSGQSPSLAKKYPQTRNCLDLKNLELPLYALMEYKLNGIIPDVFVWVFSFEETQDEKKYEQINNDFLEMLEVDLNELANNLKNQKFQFKPRNNSNCYGCYFSNFCIMKKGLSDEQE